MTASGAYMRATACAVAGSASHCANATSAPLATCAAVMPTARRTDRETCTIGSGEDVTSRGYASKQGLACHATVLPHSHTTAAHPLQQQSSNQSSNHPSKQASKQATTDIAHCTAKALQQQLLAAVVLTDSGTTSTCEYASSSISTPAATSAAFTSLPQGWGAKSNPTATVGVTLQLWQSSAGQKADTWDRRMQSGLVRRAERQVVVPQAPPCLC